MCLCRFKSFIVWFIVVVVLFAFLLSNFDNFELIAAPAIVIETTKRKPVGHKMPDAEFFEYLEEVDKHNIIIPKGGGSGEGGGAGDSNDFNAGNSGVYQDAGGTFGQAAGQGLGIGSITNQAGAGAGDKGGSTGSVKADALRVLKTQIEESRAESLKRVLETAYNIESVAASIAERESIQSSIQKRMQQESIKARIIQPETQKFYEAPVFIEETTRIVHNMEIYAEILAPTSMTNYRVIIAEEDLTPTPAYVEEINPLVKVVETIAISNIEPGDFIQVTNAKSFVTSNTNQTIVNRPTSEPKEETVTKMTLETFDSPIVEEETTSVITSKESDTKSESNKSIADEEEGRGSKGGQDAEKEEDMKGDDGENESEGMADDEGKIKEETVGEYAGKKVFEIDRNGNIGLSSEHLSVTNTKGLMFAVVTLLFLLGALTFVVGTNDKVKKSNYF